MLTMQEVADRLDVSLQRAYEMGRCGLLPTVRMGQIRVEETQLMSWIEPVAVPCRADGKDTLVRRVPLPHRVAEDSALR